MAAKKKAAAKKSATKKKSSKKKVAKKAKQPLKRKLQRNQPGHQRRKPLRNLRQEKALRAKRKLLRQRSNPQEKKQHL
jgi:hypothetical protein